MIIKISPDKERVKSIIKQVETRMKFLNSIKQSEFSTIIAETYYEIIKELITGVMFIDGFKTIGENSHKETINYLLKYKKFSSHEVSLVNDLRIKRNKSMYEGKEIRKDYIKSKEKSFLHIIEKLKSIFKDKLS